MKIAIVARSIIAQILFVIDKLLCRNNGKFVVACFHSFSGESGRYASNPDIFEGQLVKIMANAEIIHPNQINEIMTKPTSGRRKVLVTIDDGYKSVLKILPITNKYNISALLFVLADSQAVNRSEVNTEEELLSLEDIKQLQKNGWIIGSHSMTHASLIGLDHQAKLNEIANSKKVLEKNLKIKITTFAYPRGFYDEESISLVKKAGYEFAFSIDADNVTSSSNRFTLPRTIIDSSHKVFDVPAIFSCSWLNLRKLTNHLKLWERFLS